MERAHGCTKVSEPVADGVKLKGQSFVVRQPVTDVLWSDHLEGKQSLGIIPINEKNECVWGCVDIDSYAGFDHKKLIDKIKEAKLPSALITASLILLFFGKPFDRNIDNLILLVEN